MGTDPLTSQLLGGPLDGAEVALNPAVGILIGFEDPLRPGYTHEYLMRLIQPGRLEYLRTTRPKAVRLKGGLDPVQSKL